MALQGEGREERVVGQVIRRLIPYIFLCYVVGFVGPSVVGWLRKGTESYATGLLFLAAGS